MKRFIALFLCFAFVFALTSCAGKDSGSPATSSPGSAPSAPANSTSGESSAPAVKTITWDFLDLDSATHPVVTILKEWSDEIYKRTNSQLKINIRVGGELPFTTSEYLNAVSQGSVQMAGCMSTAVASDIPCGGLTSLCYLCTSYEELPTMMEVLDPYLNQELDSYGVKNLFTIAYPTQELFGRGNTPGNITDLKGFLLRTSGSEQAKFWKQMGLVPTSIDASEVISSLNKNVIDGVTTAVITIDMSKWCDSLDWAYIVKSMILPTFCVVNKKAFDELPADVQKVLVDVSNDYKVTFGKRMDEFTANSYKALETAGMEIKYATDEEIKGFTEAAMPLWDNYTSSIGGNTAQVLSEIRKALGK